MSFKSTPVSNCYTNNSGTASVYDHTYVLNGAPSSSTLNGPNGPFSLGDRILNGTSGDLYYLSSVSTSGGITSATWVLLAQATGALDTLTGDSGTATPSAGTITVSGGTTGLTTTGTSHNLNLGGTLVVANGGTGAATLTTHGVLLGKGTSAIAATSAGTSGQVLISGGASADPAFGAVGVNSALTGLVIGNNNTAFTTVTYTPVTAWTPNLQINGSSTGITYTTQTGFYTQLGNLVQFGFRVLLSSKGASSGTVTISNMPVATGSNGLNFEVSCIYSGVTFTATNVGVSLQMGTSSQVATFNQFGGAETSIALLANTNISNTFNVHVTGTYLIA